MIYMNDTQLAHYGVKGMKWGVRKSKAQLAREKSSSYSNKKQEWTREPTGGSFKKQIAVIEAQNNVKNAKTRTEKKTAKRQLNKAKKDLKDGYEEYHTFEKDMHKKYGKTKSYKYDEASKLYINKKTGKSIKDYEYVGMQNYELMKTRKTFQMQANMVAGAAIAAYLLTTIGMGSVPYKNI